MNRLVFLLSLIAALALVSCGDPVAASGGDGAIAHKNAITIGTGSVNGVYYPIGKTLALIISNELGAQGYKGQNQSTGGSVYNINAVCTGDLQLGVAQSDRQYQAVNGLNAWEGNHKANLRAICSLHPEAMALIASQKSGIDSIEALKGKRVNIGNPGSGHRANAEDVLIAFGLTDSAIQPEVAKAIEAPRLLEEGRVDAFFFTAGHPNDNITESLAGSQPVRFVPITGPAVDALVAEKPYYSKTVIPQSAYPQAHMTSDVSTIGVRATLVTSDVLSEEQAYLITKAIFDQMKLLKGVHPALELLTPESMLESLSAPLHAGAERYYREAGLLR